MRHLEADASLCPEKQQAGGGLQAGHDLGDLPEPCCPQQEMPWGGGREHASHLETEEKVSERGGGQAVSSEPILKR